MSSLICIPIHSTEKNIRTKYTKETLLSTIETVDYNKHRLCLIDDDSCEEAKEFIKEFVGIFNSKFNSDNLIVIANKFNIGTANSVNKAIRLRRKDEYFLKKDDDVVIHQNGWIEQMEECFKRQPKIGILGLKRKDLDESLNSPNEQFKSKIVELPRTKGMSWMYVEQVKGVMGTCTMFNPALLDKIGYMQQIETYGFDDSLISLKSTLCGFANAFLPYIEISHIDTARNDDGTINEYITWKQQQAGRVQKEVGRLAERISSGIEPLYHEPNWELIN